MSESPLTPIIDKKNELGENKTCSYNLDLLEIKKNLVYEYIDSTHRCLKHSSKWLVMKHYLNYVIILRRNMFALLVIYNTLIITYY